MPLNYQIKDGIEYAKDPGVSYRTEKGVRKKGAVYLGRVIDKDKRLFYNKSRGVFHYDEDMQNRPVYSGAERMHVKNLLKSCSAKTM